MTMRYTPLPTMFSRVYQHVGYRCLQHVNTDMTSRVGTVQRLLHDIRNEDAMGRLDDELEFRQAALDTYLRR